MNTASPSNNFHYNKKLQPFANSLRKTMTKSEACMWKYLLRAKTMHGYRFRRQRPVLNYIADFCCLELLLIIEVDGLSHEDEIAVKRDAIKDQDLRDIGFEVLRFSSWEVLNRMADVDILSTNWINSKINTSEMGISGGIINNDSGD
ncbi:MAG: endonuclease domain-containing protein [Saprospiraceae bacterium]|nr:endonuclease domain-containing protein [Saprospiraceae bacterium]